MNNHPSQQEKHEFAIYSPSIDTYSALASGMTIKLIDRECVHRMQQVLRLHADDTVQLFGTKNYLHARIVNITQRECIISIIENKPLKPLAPLMDAAVPLLERAAFEETLALLTILGINTIIPYTSHKTKRTALSTSERERLHRIMIAAAEQSKQYVIPTIHTITPLTSLSLPSYHASVTFDQHGTMASEIMPKIVALPITARLLVICGPEGDFIERERAFLQESGTHRCRLTPTVLRTEHAYTIGVGMIRSLLYSQ